MSDNKSLSEVNSSVNTTGLKNNWRKFFAFLGPAYMISVGYMDPGNWATDIEGGSKFGYSLIWVLVMSNIIALILQSHCARLGVVTGKDLAQASREYYPKFTNIFLYILAEIAIAACDLAEVIGMAIGLNLLFGLPLIWGVSITVLDSFLLLFLLNFGVRKLEAFIICLVAIIGASFLVEMFLVKPNMGDIAGGLIPSIKSTDALYIAIGIIGATVMPHNLYLHSSLVQTRRIERTEPEIKKAIKYNVIDSAIALNLALFVNAAILILAATSFFKNGKTDVADIRDAHELLAPMVGSSLAPILFAVALIAAGQSSTITGTLAGQIVMEGYLNLRIQPWVRRILTRVIAIGPSIFAIIYFGESATQTLLILSQVILSLQLGFAVIPLLHIVSDKKQMGNFAIKIPIKIISWLSILVIIGLNINYLFNKISTSIEESSNPIVIWLTLVPIVVFCLIMLVYISIKPLLKSHKTQTEYKPHIEIKQLRLEGDLEIKHIAITVDFSDADEKTINKAIQLGGIKAKYTLIHITETPNAFLYGKESNDLESEVDESNLKIYQHQLKLKGFKADYKLGFGSPKKAIPEIVNATSADLLIMGSHGHKGLKDFLFGTTIESVRHDVRISVLVV